MHETQGKLAGRVALVTGGSRGIGAGIATTFAREGASVVITYLSREDAAKEVVERVRSHGVAGHAIRADVSHAEECRAAVEEAVERFGRINVLVNNAGTIGAEVHIADMAVEEWDKLIGTDLRGVFLTTKFALPHIPSEPVGKIINIASELALKGRAGYGHYCAAKGGVIAFTYALAHEVAPGICANVIAPGPIETDMILADMAPEWIEKEKEIPAGRLGRVDEIAETAVLLASSAGDFFIGQVISPNGGAVFR
ncbi:MAG TPA: 3-oxoacyl-ACP reductase family protein [Candidatus Limnocylindria bacterium]